MTTKQSKPLQSGKEANKIDSRTAQEMGRKGGIKSGEVRREKRTMKKYLECLLQMKSPKGNIYIMDGIKASLDRWVETGDPQIFEKVQNLLGEKPKDHVEIETNQETLKAYEKAAEMLKGG